MAVYLLHSSKTLGRGALGRATHYIGHAEDHRLWLRLSEHATLSDRNPSIIRAFLSAGAELHLVRVWAEGGRALERHLKERKKGPQYCPVCQRNHPLQSFPTTSIIRLMTHHHGSLPSPARLLESTGNKPVGTLESARGSSPRQLTPLSRTSSVGIVVSRGNMFPPGSTSCAPASPDSEASSSASTKLLYGSRGSGWRRT